ncbi:MAG TPA: tetratricopeptide repeat protein, partial [Longimicrobiales bacterium]|nr:tetratricopeptide repeat protein [Longimicrobiales bacterium]
GIYASRIQAYNNLGVCYTEWGRYTEAEGALRTALDFSVQSEFGLKDKMVSLDNLAILSYEQRKFEDSLNYARMSLEANAPLESRRAWLCSLGIAGLCSLHLGRLADAREYEREISIGPKLEEYWLSDISYAEIFLARMQHHRGRTPAAVARLEWCAEAFEGRDFFCSNRMKVERLRLSLDRNRDVALRDIRNLLPELRAALAGTLASRLEEVLNRVHP